MLRPHSYDEKGNHLVTVCSAFRFPELQLALLTGQVTIARRGERKMRGGEGREMEWREGRKEELQGAEEETGCHNRETVSFPVYVFRASFFLLNSFCLIN